MDSGDGQMEERQASSLPPNETTPTSSLHKSHLANPGETVSPELVKQLATRLALETQKRRSEAIMERKRQREEALKKRRRDLSKSKRSKDSKDGSSATGGGETSQDEAEEDGLHATSDFSDLDTFSPLPQSCSNRRPKSACGTGRGKSKWKRDGRPKSAGVVLDAGSFFVEGGDGEEDVGSTFAQGGDGTSVQACRLDSDDEVQSSYSGAKGGRAHFGYYARFRNTTVRVVRGPKVETAVDEDLDESIPPATSSRPGSSKRHAQPPLFKSVFPKTKAKATSKSLFSKENPAPTTTAAVTSSKLTKSSLQGSAPSLQSSSPYPPYYPNLPILPPNIVDFCVGNEDDFGEVEEYPGTVLHGCYDRGGDWAKSTSSASHIIDGFYDEAASVSTRPTSAASHGPSPTAGVIRLPVASPDSPQDPKDQFFIRIYAGGRPLTKLSALSSILSAIKPPQHILQQQQAAAAASVTSSQQSRSSITGRSSGSGGTEDQAKTSSTLNLLLEGKSAVNGGARPTSSRITFAKEPTVSVIGVDQACSTPFERLNAITESNMVDILGQESSQKHTNGSSNPSSRATSIISFESGSNLIISSPSPSILERLETTSNASPATLLRDRPDLNQNANTYRAIVNATPAVANIRYGNCPGGPGTQQTIVRNVIKSNSKPTPTSAPAPAVAQAVATHPRRRQSSVLTTGSERVTFNGGAIDENVGEERTAIGAAAAAWGIRTTLAMKKNLSSNSNGVSSIGKNGAEPTQADHAGNPQSQLFAKGIGSVLSRRDLVPEAIANSLDMRRASKDLGEGSADPACSKSAEIIPDASAPDMSGTDDKKDRSSSGELASTSKPSTNPLCAGKIDVASSSNLPAKTEGEVVRRVPHRSESVPSFNKRSSLTKKISTSISGSAEPQKTVITAEESVTQPPNVVRSCTVKAKKDEPLEILVYRSTEKPKAVDPIEAGYILRYAEIDFSHDQLHNPLPTSGPSKPRPNSASTTSSKHNTPIKTSSPLPDSKDPSDRKRQKGSNNPSARNSSWNSRAETPVLPIGSAVVSIPTSRAGSAGTARVAFTERVSVRSETKARMEDGEDGDGENGAEGGVDGASDWSLPMPIEKSKLTLQEMQILQSIENLNKVLFSKLLKIGGTEKP
ncbi:hypothetical protein HDU97_000708 [Phlyctochytrium planicorne]|nr:hypothetical protein HDU97_000708 [Phlyctochytrium planicorne]